MLNHLIYLILAYLIGSVPFGYLAGKIKGIDLREHGSCNIGATNAVRVLGKAWGIPVFFCDFLKGLLPLLFVKLELGGDVTQLSASDMAWLLGTMFALVLGHTFTCFLHFKGGKGVATSAGCFFAISPLLGGVALGTWILSMCLTRYVSLSSMLAGLAACIATYFIFIHADGAASSSDWMLMGLMCVLEIFVVIKHKQNISRIMAGTEPKAFTKKK